MEKQSLGMRVKALRGTARREAIGKVVAEYDASGLRAVAFCRSAGIAAVTLARWRRELRGEGLRTRKGRKTWSHATVRNMLRNPAYKGAAVYGRTQKGPVRTPLRPRRGAPAFPRRGKSVYPVDPEQWIHVPVPRIVSDDLLEAV